MNAEQAEKIVKDNYPYASVFSLDGHSYTILRDIYDKESIISDGSFFNSADAWISAAEIIINNPTEKVDHPPHYGEDTTYEAIKVIEAWELDFCLGNAVKYLCRANKKGSTIEDLRKAVWYINRRIEQLEVKDEIPK